MSFDENPYAPPKADAVEDARHLNDYAEAWRDGKFLVVRNGADLRDRCLKCNAPAEGYRFSRRLSWHRPGWLILFVVNWFLYLLVYFVVRWQARVTVGLCPVHRESRRQAILAGWLAAFVGFITILVGASWIDGLGPAPPSVGIALLIGLLLILGGIIGGILGARVLVPVRINEHYVWLSKVSPQYLAELPDWNR